MRVNEEPNKLQIVWAINHVLVEVHFKRLQKFENVSKISRKYVKEVEESCTKFFSATKAFHISIAISLTNLSRYNLYFFLLICMICMMVFEKSRRST